MVETPKMYHCLFCGKRHRFDSEVGQEHFKRVVAGIANRYPGWSDVDIALVLELPISLIRASMPEERTVDPSELYHSPFKCDDCGEFILPGTQVRDAKGLYHHRKCLNAKRLEERRERDRELYKERQRARGR